MSGKWRFFLMMSCALVKSAIFAANQIDYWSCLYLNPEITRRIDEQKIHTIVEVGPSHGLDAISLSNHYHSPVFAFNNEDQRRNLTDSHPSIYQIPLDRLPSAEWMWENNITNIDLVCLNTPDCDHVLENLAELLPHTKYVIVAKDSLTTKGKEYLLEKGFCSFFDNVDLFDVVFFSKQEESNAKIVLWPKTHFIDEDQIIGFNKPFLEPLINGNKNSELIHASFADNHDAFHDVYCSKNFDINYQDVHGNSALIAAASSNASYPVQKLLQLPDTDCALRNENGCTALMVAIASKSGDALFHLFQDPRCIATMHMVNNAGMTAADIAKVHPEIDAFVQTRGFNTPDYIDTENNTPLMIAASKKDLSLVQRLSTLPSTDFKAQNKNGCTALMTAAASGCPKVVKKLLKSQAASTIFTLNNRGMDAEEVARTCRFPEVVKLLNAEKTRQIQSGFSSRVIPSKIVIGGICKDVAPFLPFTIQIIEKIGSLFEDYKVVIYENDSTDGSDRILKEWAARNPHINITCDHVPLAQLLRESTNQEDENQPFRIELIARARNILLDKIMDARYDDCPYVMMIDMDFVVIPDSEGILEIFQTNREWDAVFAYGKGQTNTYWDWYAFRDFNEPLGPELVGTDWFSDKHWSLKKTEEWCPVYSAFGGCGIYKRESIRGCRYSGVVTPHLEKLAKKIIGYGQKINHPRVEKYLDEVQKTERTINIFSTNHSLPRIEDRQVGVILNSEPGSLMWKMNSFVYQYPAVCEHVPFHASMIENGHGKLYINPRFIFLYER